MFAKLGAKCTYSIILGFTVGVAFLAYFIVFLYYGSPASSISLLYGAHNHFSYGCVVVLLLICLYFVRFESDEKMVFYFEPKPREARLKSAFYILLRNYSTSRFS
jgi:hypothetical protein